VCSSRLILLNPFGSSWSTQIFGPLCPPLRDFLSRLSFRFSRCSRLRFLPPILAQGQVLPLDFTAGLCDPILRFCFHVSGWFSCRALPAGSRSRTGAARVILLLSSHHNRVPSFGSALSTCAGRGSTPLNFSFAAWPRVDLMPPHCWIAVARSVRCRFPVSGVALRLVFHRSSVFPATKRSRLISFPAVFYSPSPGSVFLSFPAIFYRLSSASGSRASVGATGLREARHPDEDLLPSWSCRPVFFVAVPAASDC
jgi:hypothetical protein